MGFLIGKCTVWPPSAKAAVLLAMWFYGVPGGDAMWPGYWTEKEAAMAQQYVSAGATKAEAAKKVAVIEECFGTWTPHR